MRMTPRERVEAVLLGTGPDQVPFTTYQYMVPPSETERRLRIFSVDAYVSIDYQKKYGIFVRRTGNVDSIRDTVARIKSGEIEDLSQLNFADLVNIEELQIDDIEPLRAELDSFIDAVTGKAPAPVTGEDGLAAVELAERIVAAVNQNPLGTV